MIHLLASVLVGVATTPVRTLVYSFTVGVTNASSDASMATQSNNTRGQTSDLGTITITVRGVEPDGGLVVDIAEAARTNRSVAPATCVTYSSTNVICGATVTPEETSVLRTLNPKFFDPSALDTKGHWSIATPASSGVTIDYIAAKSATPGSVDISGTRDEKSPQTTVHSEMTYAYDTAKLVSTQVKEYQTIRVNQGAQRSVITVDITANLTTDSGLGQ